MTILCGVCVIQGKQIPQGATIVKLVTTQAGGTGKPTAIITSQAGGQTPSNILGISSVQPQVRTVQVCRPLWPHPLRPHWLWLYPLRPNLLYPTRTNPLMLALPTGLTPSCPTHSPFIHSGPAHSCLTLLDLLQAPAPFRPTNSASTHSGPAHFGLTHSGPAIQADWTLSWCGKWILCMLDPEVSTFWQLTRQSCIVLFTLYIVSSCELWLISPDLCLASCD